MSFSGFPEFNIDDLTGFDNNSYGGDSFGFDRSNWDLPDVAGPSQHYSGADVQGGLNGYQDFPSPFSAPTSLYPIHGEFSNEGYNSSFYQGVTTPSFSPQATTIPLPLSIHPRYTAPSPESYAVPVVHTQQSYAQPQVVSNPDDLGFGFFTAAGSSSLPAVHPPPPNDPSYEELQGQHSQCDPFRFDAPPFYPVTGDTPPGVPLPPPVVTSSGPKRTGQPAREGRRYDPVKSARKKADSSRDNWNQTLVRFRFQLDTLYSVRNGQPSGGLVPETALAEIDKQIKEDLKRSPLRDTEAGKGKRSRGVEDYLKGLLKAIRPTPTSTGADSNEDDTTTAALSRLAEELEAKLAVVNQQPALLQSSRSGRRLDDEQTTRRAKKNGTEKTRRDRERHHLERISRLFRVSPHPWSKKDVLMLAVVFLLYGSEAFPHGLVAARPVAPRV